MKLDITYSEARTVKRNEDQGPQWETIVEERDIIINGKIVGCVWKVLKEGVPLEDEEADDELSQQDLLSGYYIWWESNIRLGETYQMGAETLEETQLVITSTVNRHVEFLLELLEIKK